MGQHRLHIEPGPAEGTASPHVVVDVIAVARNDISQLIEQRPPLGQEIASSTCSHGLTTAVSKVVTSAGFRILTTEPRPPSCPLGISLATVEHHEEVY